jgi:hypothetical protein
MEFPEELRKELALSFTFKRTIASWKPMRKRPDILRLTNQDCSQQYREPQLLGNLDHAFVEVRVYDDKGINTADGANILGDWEDAKARCEAFLNSLLKKTPGHEKDSIYLG